MYTNQLVEHAKSMKINNFIGVFALDKLPKHTLPPPSRFIVNSNTHNLPGEHWIAVSYENGGIVRAFDPLGVYYPTKLVHYLANSSRQIVFNRTMYQNPLTRTCGQHCLLWLKQRSINTDLRSR